MLFSKIARERRRKKWKSTRKFQKARKQKQRLESELGKLKKRLEPDQTHNVDGILVAVHTCRGRYRDEIEFRFEFDRKDAFGGPASDFGMSDLETLIKAIRATEVQYRRAATVYQ